MKEKNMHTVTNQFLMKTFICFSLFPSLRVIFFVTWRIAAAVRAGSGEGMLGSKPLFFFFFTILTD